MSAVKERAVNTREGVRQIMGEVLETVSEAVAAELPSKSSMARSIQRERNRNDLPPLPQTLEQLGDIPDELKVRVGYVTSLYLSHHHHFISHDAL